MEKLACVSVWSISKPLPAKPKTYADALYMQKPAIEKTMKKLACQLVNFCVHKRTNCLNSVYDMLRIEIESAVACKEMIENDVKFDGEE